MARPREFEETKALDAAMDLFWRQGYDGTSLQELTRAMGINKPSLYATFGNKAELFRKALQRYTSGPGAPVMAALELPTAREAVEAMLRFYADAADQVGRPPGCLVVNGALACSDEARPLQDELSRLRVGSEAQLRKRLERAKREGELGPEVKPAALSRFIWSVLRGMAVQATDGATRTELREVARLAMQAWPGRRGL